MNRGQLNGYILNGKPADPVVRIRVDAKGYARIRARGRVIAYGVVASTPAAVQAGIGGRVNAQIHADSIARAVVDGVLGHVDIHGILAATGRAIVKVELPPIHGRVNARGQAKTILKAHIKARNAVGLTGQAKLTPKTQRLSRGPVKSTPLAQIQADGTVFVRRWLRSPVDSREVAFIVSNHHVDARLAALTKAEAKPAVKPHVLIRSPQRWTGVAHIEIDPSIHKRLPFDEPAPESRVFIVSAGVFTFYVTE